MTDIVTAFFSVPLILVPGPGVRGRGNLPYMTLLPQSEWSFSLSRVDGV